MTLLSKAIFFAVATIATSLAQPAESWAMPRNFSSFQFLLDRSPFSLPTAEESSPLAERFALTGAVGLNGEAIVFVLDKTTQARHMLSKTPNDQNMGLVEYLPDTDPRRMRATIRVNGQVATISYSEATLQPQQALAPHTGAGVPTTQAPSAIVKAPVPAAPGSPAFQAQQNSTPPNRRVIRRRIVSGQPAPGP